MNRPRTTVAAWVGVTLGGCRPQATVVTGPMAPEACKQVHIVATNTASLQPFLGCHEIASLTARTGAAIDFGVLTNLETVHGDVRIGPSVAINEIALPALQVIHGALRVAGNTAVTGVFASRLQQVGTMEFANNAALATISLPKLQSVAGDFVVQRNSDLSTVLAPSLQRVKGRVGLLSCRSLEMLEFSKQFSAGEIEMAGLPRLDWTMVPGAPPQPPQSAAPTPPNDPAF